MAYVYAPSGTDPAEISLHDLMRRLKEEGVSPPDFLSIQDKALLLSRLADFDVYPCEIEAAPEIDTTNEALNGWGITNVNGTWVKRADIRALSPDEKAAAQRKSERIRTEAIERDMREVADPIFMQYQAGEATREEWLEARRMVRN